jgi:hypothetical protein
MSRHTPGDISGGCLHSGPHYIRRRFSVDAARIDDEPRVAANQLAIESVVVGGDQDHVVSRVSGTLSRSKWYLRILGKRERQPDIV